MPHLIREVKKDQTGHAGRFVILNGEFRTSISSHDGLLSSHEELQMCGYAPGDRSWAIYVIDRDSVKAITSISLIRD